MIRTMPTVIAMICLLTCQAAAADVASKRADARQQRQAERISDGWQNGALTRRETATLTAQQGHIRRAEKRFEADGKLNNRERARLEVKQDRASRSIYRKKHNARHR